MIDWKSISLENFAGFIAEELRKKGVSTILVGGACVTIYSRNRYQSYDLDFITYEDMSKVSKILLNLGFQIKDRYFVREECPWFIEFVSPPVAIGNQPIEEFEERKTDLGTLRMLTPTDSVKDRLASYYHWRDKQGLEQAIDICIETPINMDDVKQWSIQEGFLDEFEEFYSLLKKKLN